MSTIAIGIAIPLVLVGIGALIYWCANRSNCCATASEDDGGPVVGGQNDLNVPLLNGVSATADSPGSMEGHNDQEASGEYLTMGID